MSSKSNLYNFVLNHCKDEYKDKTDTFSSIDSKAQQTCAFSGLLMGFLFSICKEETLAYLASINKNSITILIIAIALLLIAITLAIITLRVREIATMPQISYFKEEFNLLKNLPNTNINETHINNYINSFIEHWQVTFESLAKTNACKAKYLFLSQICCSCGIIAIGIIAIIITFSFY